MSTTLVLQALITGLLLGGLYALVSSGLSIIMGVMNIVNFAHGEFLMLALYLAWGLAVFADFNVYATMLVTIPVLFLFGALVFKGTIERVLQKPILVQIILTLGLSMFLQGLATALFSADVRSVANPYSQMTLKFAGMFISVPYVIAFVGSCLAFLFLWWVLQKTEMGRSIRASAQNAGAAQLMGIDIRKTYLLAFGIGSALV
ncbi:MAG: branched-chain amino acid ABC transporter permease, partial [Deltaproteobacteria bacterium HGW-Deltaproteobacteria-20]